MSLEERLVLKFQTLFSLKLKPRPQAESTSVKTGPWISTNLGHSNGQVILADYIIEDCTSS